MKTVKVRNMVSENGTIVPNQFIIETDINKTSGNCVQYFQSYDSVIAKIDRFRAEVKGRQVWLDSNKWNYSVTTSQYLSIFLGETITVIRKKVESGEYILTDLN